MSPTGICSCRRRAQQPTLPPSRWRFYAHLLVHQSGYQSAATRTRRSEIPTDRRAGVDANVSNLALASLSEGHSDTLLVGHIGCSPEQLTAAARAAKQARCRQRTLDRSRRNTNPEHYGPSPRQAARAERRACVGLRAKQVTNPGGPRRARVDRVPLRGYGHDRLCGGYQRIQSDHAAETRSASQAKHARARDIAARIVAIHGNTITAEDCRVSTWARLWGKRISVFSPGMLVAALKQECAATGGALSRAGTQATAMTQHCLCGQRVPKTLAQRIHDWPQCGLHADRDIASAALAACVHYATPDGPASARVDYRLTHALRAWLASQQEREGSVNRHQPPASPDAGRPGPAATTRWPLLSKQHSASPRTDQTTRLDVADPAQNNQTPN